MKPKPFTILAVLHGLIIVLAILVLWRRPPEKRTDKDAIAVIPIEGIITMDRGAMSHGESIDELVDAIDELKDKPRVKALVLKINSPGGSVGAVQELYDAVVRFKKSGRPVVSTFGDLAASGGYYVACAGDRIVTHPGTLTGSIGVLLRLPNVTTLMQKIGVSMNTLTSGPMKDAGSPFRAMTAEEQAHFKGIIDDAYGQFFDAVKTGRNLTPEALKPLADGRVFSGRQAVEKKLADQLGGTKEAIDLAKEMAGLSGKNPRILEHHEKKSLERLLQLFGRTPVDHLASLAESAGPELLYLLN
ncbi:MAG: signal peptide peptidase SppA [Elusimicrobia bacterium]|nr:signal peptide peptidase SppA [Elusimicrobiota bacterium]